MLEQTLQELSRSAQKRIAQAETPAALEAVRVEVLGRKGSLANISKDMGKLSPEQRTSIGKLLNGAKQSLESALDGKKAAFDEQALRARLDSEWLDLTLPPPQVEPGSLHPPTQLPAEA